MLYFNSMNLFTAFKFLSSTVNTMMSENSCLLRRKTLKLSCPNPLFDKWLQEWKDEAASKNADMQHAFAKVIYALPHSVYAFVKMHLNEIPMPFHMQTQQVVKL